MADHLGGLESEHFWGGESGGYILSSTGFVFFPTTWPHLSAVQKEIFLKIREVEL